MTTTISSKGQITVPVEIREALGLSPGTRLEIRLGPGGTFLAEKVQKESFFARFQGIGSKSHTIYRDSNEALNTLRGEIVPGDVDEA